MKSSKRFRLLDSNVSPGLMIYDKITDMIILDICTGNKQIDEIIAKTAWEIIHNGDFLEYIKGLI